MPTPTSVLRAACAGALMLAIAGVAPAADKTAKEARDLADKVQSVTAPGKAGEPAEPLPKGDPCALLTQAEVAAVFPKASPGKRERTREKYGITACVYEHAGGQLGVQLWLAGPGVRMADEADGLAAGMVDPVMRGARKNVRIETIKGLGDDAAAFAERADPKRGILSTGAIAFVRRGERVLTIGDSDFGQPDRAGTLKTLEALARQATARL
jgi:hypothetical protein